MTTAAAHGWMVSAIILIRPVHNSPAGAWIRDAAHPDAEPSGMYVMPNFTTRAGVEAYAAAMNFLAERYSRPDGRYGRIHDWIMHNEIGSGFYLDKRRQEDADHVSRSLSKVDAHGVSARPAI